ncbi:MAG: type IV pilus assembly protein PilE [Gammaproteobacteria bacterium]|jgi:type IV pilus assembly protein PilE
MKKHKGFTLIELMIVVAIVAIISAVAIPAYSSQSRKAKRSDAQQLMLDAANRQQQYLLDARQYTTSFAALNVTKDGWTCDATDCDNNFYIITMTNINTATPPTFMITATAQAGSQLVDGNITLSSTGAKTLNSNSGW